MHCRMQTARSWFPWVGINAYVIGEANGEWLANYAKENNLAGDPEVGLR